jgi:mRNA interferase YafQ
MSSATPRGDRRPVLPRSDDHTRAFTQGWERLARSGRYDLRRLREAMLLLIARDGRLEAQWRDHPLRGERADHRECHAGGGLLLVYRPSEDAVLFVRLGIHADLFER